MPDVTLFETVVPTPGTPMVDTAKFKKCGPYTIGMSDWGVNNNFRLQAIEAAKMKAKELGVTLKFTDAHLDTTKQIADVEDLLAQHIDALLISPGSVGPLAPVVAKATATGIPVILYMEKAGTTEFTSIIHSDDFQWGVLGAQKLVQDMNLKGNLIAVRGVAGNSSDTDRYKGMRSVVDKYPAIKIVGEDYGDWQTDKGKTVCENMLAAHPQIDGVWSAGAAMTESCITVWQDAGKPLIPMSGEHLNGFLKQWVATGIKSSGPIFPSYQAPEAVKLAVLALEGKPIGSDYNVVPPPIIDPTKAVKPDLSNDYWVEGYLTDAQAKEIFPK